MSFSGKVVIVTGAGSGIGAATAFSFTKEGAQVVLVDRNGEKLNKVALECTQQGSTPLVIIADITSEQETSTIIEKTIDHFGKLDVLVNNAGIIRYAPVSDPNILKIFDEVINTNLRSIVQLTSLACPYLVKTKGNIVNVSSIAALKVEQENYMSYSVSKAGLTHFTRCAARDLAASGVRVNSVNPGPVRTDILQNYGMSANEADTIFRQQGNKSPLGRICKPEDIANVIVFLASDRARSITGSVHVIDNGQMLM